MNTLIPDKLINGDEIRVVAPARSLSILGPELRGIADEKLRALGFKVTFGRHSEEIDSFSSASVESRLQDLHDAFADQNVRGILTVIGGFNSNQLLGYIDWELIRSNPKVFCGFSDITALNNAIFARTGLVNYSGPHYASFGQKRHFEYTLDYFLKCCRSIDPFSVAPSNHWSEDTWHRDQDNRILLPNNGWLVINEGEARGTLIGGNLCTFNLLQGTPFMPNIADSILFLEDDARGDGYDIREFDRNLQSVIHLPEFPLVKGLLLGRFQTAFGMTDDLIAQIIRSKRELSRLPIIANVDFGHTEPRVTLPIGGDAVIQADKSNSDITILTH